MCDFSSTIQGRDKAGGELSPFKIGVLPGRSKRYIGSFWEHRGRKAGAGQLAKG